MGFLVHERKTGGPRVEPLNRAETRLLTDTLRSYRTKKRREKLKPKKRVVKKRVAKRTQRRRVSRTGRNQKRVSKRK